MSESKKNLHPENADRISGKLKWENRGIAIYLAVITMSILLSIAFGMSAVSIGRIKNITSMGNSVVAFYAAETGIEQALKEASDETYSISHAYLDINGNGYEDSQDAVFQVDGIAPGIGGCPSTYDYCLESVGEYMSTRRTIQVEFK
jgi:hypothetical protein